MDKFKHECGDEVFLRDIFHRYSKGGLGVRGDEEKESPLHLIQGNRGE